MDAHARTRGVLLLDTSVVVDLFRGRPGVQDELEKAGRYFLPTVTIGELYYGAYRSQRTRENVNRIQAFIATSTVLTCDVGTAREYGYLRRSLEQLGRPLPENDIWIAALALQHRLTVATQDAHYQFVPGLSTLSC